MLAKQAAVEEMCPQYPEPVPLKHPITSLKAALEKVNFFQLLLIHIYMFLMCCECSYSLYLYISLFKQIDVLLRLSVHSTKLPAISAIVVLNDSVLWNGNFGKRNISDSSSSAPNEYTVYR